MKLKCIFCKAHPMTCICNKVDAFFSDLEGIPRTSEDLAKGRSTSGNGSAPLAPVTAISMGHVYWAKKQRDKTNNKQ